MTQMPFQLATLPPEALDILRFFGKTDTTASYPADAIIDGGGMSERAFGKGLRRLINKKMLVMDGESIYKTTDLGRRTIAELIEWDMTAPERGAQAPARHVMRRVFVGTPRVLLSGQPVYLYVGFDEADDDEILSDDVDIVIRLTLIDGVAANTFTVDKAFRLTNYATRQAFEIAGGMYDMLRIRVQVTQPDVTDDESPGMYIDLPVTVDPTLADPSLVAYSTSVMIREG
jgi:predicted transcriptional regulator